jgi:aerobic-type carbon monoxide dehydrogenase small subunit (CoxS/CutS family)
MEENHKKNKSGISRRTFIRGAGLTTAGTLAIQTGVLASTSETDKATKELGPDAVTISMNVNGRVRKLNVEPRATLAKALREELQLTGTKVVCDRGSCSACTVWLDNTPVNACMTFAMDVGEKKVTTIEGLAKNGALHPIQEAFIEHDASQCGFCTPGMIMSTASLINQNPNPSIDDVKHATRGNYCRCGTYPHVFKATLAAAKKM